MEKIIFESGGFKIVEKRKNNYGRILATVISPDKKVFSPYWGPEGSFSGKDIAAYINEALAAWKVLNLQEVVSWRDTSSGYTLKAAERCIEEKLILTYQYQGRSSVESRNKISLLTVEKASVDTVERCQQILREEQVKASLESWEKLLSGEDVALVSCFNKTAASITWNEVESVKRGFDVVWHRTTTCRNTTALLVRVSQIIKCPNELKGLLIGCGGQRIKELAKKHGLSYIKVV